MSRARILVVALVSLATFASTAHALVWKLGTRGVSEGRWRGYARGESFVGQANATFELFGYNTQKIKDSFAVQPQWLLWADVEGEAPLDQRGTEGDLDEGRIRLAFEGPCDPNTRSFFAGGAVTYYAGDQTDAHDIHAVEWSARIGKHWQGRGAGGKAGHERLPMTLRGGVDHFTDSRGGTRAHALGVIQLPIPNLTSFASVQAAWSNYPEPGISEPAFTFHDLEARLESELQVSGIVSIESGVFGIRGAHPGLPTSTIGLFFGLRYGKRSSRSFGRWGEDVVGSSGF
jgi:hypothetical protein